MRRVVPLVVGMVLLAGCAAAPNPAAPDATTAPVVPTTTSEAPTPVADAEPERQPLVIHGTGDVNLDPGYIPALAGRWTEAWSGLDGLFVDDDLTVINLECPVSTLGTAVPKEFNFRCSADALPAAHDAGVDVANLANNHSGDYGPQALLDTIPNVREAGIDPVGVGEDAEQAHEPALIEVGGWTIAVLGFGGVIPDPSWLAGASRPGMADGDTIATMTAAVERAAAVADLVVVSIHWGAELETSPQAGDVERAHAMVDAGADIIFGHHAHRLQPLDVYEGSPIAWGLGNFVWPNLSAAGSDSAVAEVRVAPDGSMTACLLPVTIVSAGHPELDGPAAC